MRDDFSELSLMAACLARYDRTGVCDSLLQFGDVVSGELFDYCETVYDTADITICSLLVFIG